MADISVSLGLEDSKYTNGIKKAEASAKNLGTTVENSLNKSNVAFQRLASNVDSLNVKFSAFTNLLVGAGITQFIGSTIASADALVDMADALGVNVARLQEMQMAAVGAGGSAEGLAQAIGRMEVNIQAAIDGNANMRKSLAAVGVTIDDINSKTPDQIFNQMAVAISKVEDPTKRAALATELFGKSARGIDFRSYVQNIVSVYGSMSQYEESQRRAADLADKLALQIGLVRTAFLDLLSPILNIITPTNDMAGSMNNAKIAAYALGTAFAVFTGVKLISAIQAIGSAWSYVTGSLVAASVATATNTSVIAANTLATTANSAARASAVAAAGALAAADGVAAAAQNAYNLALFGYGPASAQATAAASTLAVAQARAATAAQAAAIAQAELTAATVATGGAAGAAASGGLAALVARLGGLVGIAAIATGALALFWSTSLGDDTEGDSVLKLNMALGQLTKSQLDNYNSLTKAQKESVKQTLIQNMEIKKQQDLMSKITGEGQPTTGTNVFAETPEEKAARERMAAKTKAETEAINALTAAYSQANATKENGLRASLNQVTMSDREVTIVQALAAATADYESKRQSLQQKINNYRYGSVEEQAQVERLQISLKALTGEYQIHAQQIAILTDKLYQEREARALVKFGTDEQVKAQQQLQRIQDDIAKSTLTEIERKYYDIEAAAKASAKAAIDAEAARTNAPVSADRQTAYYEAAMKGADDLKAKTRELYDQSRSFETGWKNAFNNYADDATNAAKQAEKIFTKVTQSMEDAIVEFAKTGKFEFKGFINSVLEDLLRSQVRQLISQIFGLGGGGSSGGGSAILGAVKGVGKLLGFANGGTIPTNGPVIVGERGPEILMNAAGRTVIPNSQLGGSSPTYVNYTIQAVDAMSFKQLVARDPSFIHAVAEQGRKSVPSTRR